MSDWTPPPPVRFDHAAATRLLEEVWSARRTVEAVLAGHAVAVEQVRIGWRGDARVTHDVALAAHHRSLLGIHQDLRRLSDQVDEAVASARRLQHGRDELQRRWAAEAARERADS